MPGEDAMDAYEAEIPKTWTVADGQVYAHCSPNLTIRVEWHPENQGDAAGFQAELYDKDHLLSTAFWEWQTPDIAEFIQVVKPMDAVSVLANIVDDEREEEGEIATPLESLDDYEVPVEESSHAPSTSFLERLKPVLTTMWTWTARIALWTADRLIDLMLLVQTGQRRIAPTKRIKWPEGLKEQLMRRQRNKCAYCGHRFTDHYFEIDHMVPATYGGSNDPSNLQVLCRPCNGRKRDQTDQDFRRRYAELVPGRCLTPPSRPVAQKQFDAVTRITEPSMALRQRRKLRFITAREKITTGSLVGGFVAFIAVYLALENLGLKGNFAAIPAAKLGLAVGAGLWLRARIIGALYM